MKRFIIMLASLLVLAACQKDGFTGVDEAMREYTFDQNGGTVFATVFHKDAYSAESDSPWCVVESYKRQGANNLRISVDKNRLASERKAVVTVVADGGEPILIEITQKKGEPFIIVNPQNVSLSEKITDFILNIDANVDFTFTLPEWIHPTSDNVPVIGEANYRFAAEKEFEQEERTGEIAISAKDGSIVKYVNVNQAHKDLPIFEDNFDWAEGPWDIWETAASGGNMKEIRIDSWASTFTGFTNWTSSDMGTGVWSRKGYVRMCNGNTGRDLISPALSGLTQPTNVKVTFKACRYIAGSGEVDYYHEINVKVLGTGNPSQTHFDINNLPDKKDHPFYGDGWNWKDAPEASYSFTISGATADTKIQFVAGPKLGAFGEVECTANGNDNLPDGYSLSVGAAGSKAKVNSRLGFGYLKVEVID